MNKLVPLLTLLSAPWFPAAAAEESEKARKSIKPLSEEFLLFLAEMEEVEGELMHPVDVAEQMLTASKAELEGEQVATKSKGKKDESY